MFDKVKEECGVFGIRSISKGDVAADTYYALFALQHRGQESCGIAVNDNGIIRHHRDLGLVPDVFNKDVLKSLGEGKMAIGHTRYSTTGGNERENSQPVVVRHVKGQMALAHNGNILNAFELRRELEMGGAIFHATSDTEVICYEITTARLTEPSIEAAVEKAMGRLKGAYSLVIMSPRKMIAARDPHGFRPLCMGEKEDGSIVFTSESCALDTIGASLIRELEPGEIVVVSDEGIKSIKTHCGNKSGICVFEYVYFARPDSIIEGVSVHEARLNAGKKLFEEYPCEADVVIGVPDSGLVAAMGFAEASGIPYGSGLIKNRYIGRTFIQPEQGMRENSVRIKLNALKSTLDGKRIVLVDDSIVRGTTIKNIVNMIRRAGATEVHVRVSSPPFTNPCYFGTDIDSRENLIACRMSIEEIGRTIGADSIGFLSLEAVKDIAKTPHGTFCVGCFSGKYPIEVEEQNNVDKFQFEIPEM